MKGRYFGMYVPCDAPGKVKRTPTRTRQRKNIACLGHLAEVLPCLDHFDGAFPACWRESPAPAEIPGFKLYINPCETLLAVHVKR
ncbi:hypothetical protein Pnap_4400 (plasmid) [Polaromonas naphthalenivorans CJ2]|uniref:Uncharacterized protein n=1 Tax=Polaromonas naphthalenivorans (strain CJ2) TaxID=365044 RepID=A1VVK0_POLNA|nr:hypothetical protein Pnap_4400 [Polaromonas naphthalenivorans CJ2]